VAGIYDIEAAASSMNPIPDLAAAIREKPELNIADYRVIRGLNGQSFSGGEISTSGGRYYRIQLADGIDEKKAARALESAFLENGLTTVVIRDQLEATLGMIRSILGLLQSFMGMGLIVGSASIGSSAPGRWWNAASRSACYAPSAIDPG